MARLNARRKAKAGNNTAIDANFHHQPVCGDARMRNQTAAGNATRCNRHPVCILVCMARLNVYVPDDLAEQARSRGLNVSALTQAAITDELERASLSAWLDTLPTVSRSVDHDEVMAALDNARDEFGR